MANYQSKNYTSLAHNDDAKTGAADTSSRWTGMPGQEGRRPLERADSLCTQWQQEPFFLGFLAVLAPLAAGLAPGLAPGLVAAGLAPGLVAAGLAPGLAASACFAASAACFPAGLSVFDTALALLLALLTALVPLMCLLLANCLLAPLPLGKPPKGCRRSKTKVAKKQRLPKGSQRLTMTLI